MTTCQSRTVSNGVAELDAGDEPLGRTRRPGGGRKPVAETDPGAIEISVIAYSRSMNGKQP